MHEVVMPRLSDSMEEGTIIRWLKKDGTEVARGEEIVEIETDKATMAYEAEAAGTLTISAVADTTVPVGATIATIGDPAADASSPRAAAAGSVAMGAPSAPPADAPPQPAVAHGNGAGISASPVARRIAARTGVELSAIIGSGPYGRILKADVFAAQRAPAQEPPAPMPAPPPTADDAAYEKLSRPQALIARRMAESRDTVPDFAIEVDVDMSASLELRAQLKQIADVAPSVNDIVIKASAAALRSHPRANGSYRDGRFELHDAVHIGVAVAGEDTLVVPVVRDVHIKSLGAIASETRALAARVRSGEITAPELEGGTFTVSNLGMFGIDRFEGIINAPQAAILCVGTVRERPVSVHGKVVVQPTMSLTLACDHRILYGADAARFLADVRVLLEQPLGLALL